MWLLLPFLIPYMMLYPIIWPFEKLAEGIGTLAELVGFDFDRLFG